MMPDDDRKSFDKVVAHLKKRFRPIDIAELSGLEFHQKSQGEDSVEQLGLDFANSGEKSLSINSARVWSNAEGEILSSPRPKVAKEAGHPEIGSFTELYDWARMLEQHEKQYQASAQAQHRPDNKGARSDSKCST